MLLVPQLPLEAHVKTVLQSVCTAVVPRQRVQHALQVNYCTTDVVSVSVQQVLQYSKVMVVTTAMPTVSRVRTRLQLVSHAHLVVIYTQVHV